MHDSKKVLMWPSYNQSISFNKKSSPEKLAKHPVRAPDNASQRWGHQQCISHLLHFSWVFPVSGCLGSACDGQDHEGVLVRQRSRSPHGPAHQEDLISAQPAGGHQDVDLYTDHMPIIITLSLSFIIASPLSRERRHQHFEWSVS